MRRLVLIFLFCMVAHNLWSQSTGVTGRRSRIADTRKTSEAARKEPVIQQVQGRVLEKETRQPLAGAHVYLIDVLGRERATSADSLGYFFFQGVKVGIISIKVTHVGYSTMILHQAVSSSKGLDVEVLLQLSVFSLSEIAIYGEYAPVEVSFEQGNLIDPNQFNRHPGRPEAVRKAPLPGVTGADDSRNDIVVRGNSPQSVLWRLEGINIPNPNHFAIPGTSGGPVSIINDKVLAPSNFYSGAFSSQYGNTTSGIFDLQLRHGDTTEHVSAFQFGFMGAELLTEGPLSRKRKSSYLITARRSILGLLQRTGLSIGTSSLPTYSDLTFKLSFPTGTRSSLWFFGMGGTSEIDIQIGAEDGSVAEPEEKNIYGEKDRNQFFRSAMGVAGVGFKTSRRNRYFYNVIGVASEKALADHYLVHYRDEVEALNMMPGQENRVLHYKFSDKRISGMHQLTVSVDTGMTFSTGVSYDWFFFDHLDFVRNIFPYAPHKPNPDFGKWINRWASDENAVLVQPFMQWTYKPRKFHMIAGVHGQYFSLSRSHSLEPRLSLSYFVSKKTRLNVSYGHHSQMHQPYLYLYRIKSGSGKFSSENKTLDFTRSRHLVGGFERHLGNLDSRARLKVETYYQYLYDVPVDKDHATSFSLINTGADFKRVHSQRLVNRGRGDNYGLEATLDKGFSSNYLFLLTASIFQSRYHGSDNVWRNTDFNSKYIFNALAIRTWSIGREGIFSLGAKFTTAGGRWYGPVDLDSSKFVRDVVFEDATRNTLQFKPYYRVDLRLVYKWNRIRANHELSLDIVNLFNRENVLRKAYYPRSSRAKATVEDETQLPILPFFYYRVEFSSSFRKRR
jgi:hypothetical protein